VKADGSYTEQHELRRQVLRKVSVGEPRRTRSGWWPFGARQTHLGENPAWI